MSYKYPEESLKLEYTKRFMKKSVFKFLMKVKVKIALFEIKNLSDNSFYLFEALIFFGDEKEPLESFVSPQYDTLFRS